MLECMSPPCAPQIHRKIYHWCVKLIPIFMLKMLKYLHISLLAPTWTGNSYEKIQYLCENLLCIHTITQFYINWCTYYYTTMRTNYTICTYWWKICISIAELYSIIITLAVLLKKHCLNEKGGLFFLQCYTSVDMSPGEDCLAYRAYYLKSMIFGSYQNAI